MLNQPNILCSHILNFSSKTTQQAIAKFKTKTFLKLNLKQGYLELLKLLKWPPVSTKLSMGIKSLEE